jgi:hypothetical protein
MPRVTVAQLEPPEPWERRATESRAAFEAFALYRDMGPGRSHRRVAETLGKTVGVIAFWSHRHAWVARCDLWDQELDRTRQAAARQAIEEMAARHATLASSLLTKVGWRLLAVEAADLTVDQALRALEVGVRIEREARGLRAADAPSISVQQQLVTSGTGPTIAEFVRQHPEALAPVVEVLEGLEGVVGGDDEATGS